MFKKLKNYIKYRKRKKQLQRINKNFRKHMADQIDVDPEIYETVNKKFWDLL